MLNRVILQGRLIKDPELKATGNGTKVTAFTVACDGYGEKKAEFINCVAWKNSAEIICKYFTKGKMILIEGHISTRTWEDKNKKKNYATEVIVDSINFCGDKTGDKTASTASPEFTEIGDDDGDLPF